MERIDGERDGGGEVNRQERGREEARGGSGKKNEKGVQARGRGRKRKRREVERRRDGTTYIRGNKENKRYSGGEMAESGRGVGGRG